MKLTSETRLLLIMTFFVLLGGGGMALLNRTPALQPIPTPTPAAVTWTPQLFQSYVDGARHSRGPVKGARMTIIEFGDLECPSCRRAYNTYLVKLEKAMPVRFIFYHYPLPQHHQAIPAAVATEAAGRQGKFWEMFDALYTGIDTKLSPALYTQLAAKIGLDAKKFQADLQNPALERTVRGDLQRGNAVHIYQTPTFIVRAEKSGRIAQVTGGGDLDKLVSSGTGTPPLISPADSLPN
jgi:protein-disulfide isomerase